MKTLELEFEGKGEVSGTTFKQLKKSEKAFMYELTDKETGKKRYEVFAKKVSKVLLLGISQILLKIIPIPKIFIITLVFHIKVSAYLSALFIPLSVIWHLNIRTRVQPNSRLSFQHLTNDVQFLHQLYLYLVQLILRLPQYLFLLYRVPIRFSIHLKRIFRNILGL